MACTDGISCAKYAVYTSLEIIIVNKIPLLLISFFVCGCASNYELNTNLDPQNFKNYFKPSEVALYTTDELPAGSKRLGAVSGMSCQANEQTVPASIEDARTEARIKAANLGANALTIDVCETEQETKAPACIELVTCYGRAFKTPATESE